MGDQVARCTGDKGKSSSVSRRDKPDTCDTQESPLSSFPKCIRLGRIVHHTGCYFLPRGMVPFEMSLINPSISISSLPFTVLACGASMCDPEHRFLRCDVRWFDGSSNCLLRSARNHEPNPSQLGVLEPSSSDERKRDDMLGHHLPRVRQPRVERCEERFRWDEQHDVSTKASVNAFRDLPCPVVPRGILWVEKRQHSTLDAVATRHKAFQTNLAQVASLE